MRAADSAGRLEAAGPILHRADRIAERARTHFEKHHQKWVMRSYAGLRDRSGASPAAPRPRSAAYNREDHLMRAARMLVAQRQEQRLARIERASENLVLGQGREALSR